jgi:acrylyl-CoA reductase (NADPH)
MSLKALVTDKSAKGVVSSKVIVVDEAALPEGDVLVAVEWAGLNYKDALCLNGLGNLVRTYPHVGGIDFAGRVVESRNAKYHPGQAVVLTGWRVGESRWGGYAQRARVEAGWLVALPKKLSTRNAMVLGTAGLTAMLAINKLKAEGISPDAGEILITGAGGGVGSIAVMLLARLGYQVAAVTGRPEMADLLTRIGATTILPRAELLEPSGKVLDKERWIAAIDPVGGVMLAEVLKKIRYGGVVASIGAAGGADLPGSVIPFILRGITLAGIDSVMQPFEHRVAVWDRLATLFVPSAYEPLIQEARLADLPALSQTILAGGIAGRVIINPREPVVT